MKAPALLASLAAALFFSCASAPEKPAEKPSPARTEKPKGAAEKPAGRPGAELEKPAFSALPKEARAYLVELSEAFAAGRRAYLIEQGEPAYRRRVLPLLDEERYAALLYRAGAYSREHSESDGPLPALDLGSSTGIRYVGWREKGPVLEVNGFISLRGGKEEPCSIYLLWKTSPPLILGRAP